MRRALPSVSALLGAALLAGCPAEVPPECGPFEEVFAYLDDDLDGFGSEKAVGWVCGLADGQSTNQADCDDTSELVHPGAPEACDAVDNDCNGRVDEGNAFVPWYPDADGDTYGNDREQVTACGSPGPEYTRLGGDCADGNPDVNPGTAEICNGGVDDDCDGASDDADAGVDPTTRTRFYRDEDGDGFGNELRYIDRCVSPGAGAVVRGEDCDDGRANVNPDANEVCNGDRDDDCDGLEDDEDPDIDPSTQTDFHTDADGDGYGDPLLSSLACEPTPGIGVDNALDCDDTDPWANVEQNWYADSDGDGAGDGAAVEFQCLSPGGGLVPEQNGTDCQPLDGAVFPLNPEDCFDLIDQNCDAMVDCADIDCFTEPACVPPCADDVIFPASLPTTKSADTTGESDDYTTGLCGTGGNGAGDLMYWFTSPVSGLVTVDTLGATWDTTLFVLDTCGGTEITCNDDTVGLTSQVQFNVTAGIPVLIVVDGFGSSEGAFDLHIDL